MLMRGVGRLLGGHMTGYVLAGTAISLAAFWGALVLPACVHPEALGDEKAPRASLWLLAAYPFALFFGAIYTESLFLLGVVGAFYHFTKQQFGRAALWGLLVGLTRVNGSLLVIPLPFSRFAGAARRRRSRSRWNPRWRRSIGARRLGLARSTRLFIWRLTGDPLAFLAGQARLGTARIKGSARSSVQQYSIVASGGLSGYVGAPGYDVLNALGALFALATV